MRLSTRGRYGLHAIYIMAINYDKGPVSLMDISHATGIPDSYLEQLIRKLKKDHFVDSIRGINGGYFLTKNPKDISVGEVLRSLEDFFSPTECSIAKGVCSREEYCPARKVWEKLRNSMTDSMDSISIQDMMDGDFL